MGSAVNAFPYGDLASAKVHDGATAWLDVVDYVRLIGCRLPY